MFDPVIAISGAAAGLPAQQGAEEAFQVGVAVAKHGGVLLTGATSGVPYEAAKGAKSVHGQVIGLSPASSYKEHVRSYRLPTEYHDTMFFTGMDYAGRDTLLVEMADAVIEVSGRLGTLHEFTHAFERHKIIGVLLESGGTIDMIPQLLNRAGRGRGRVITDDNPKKLVAAVFAAIEEDR